MYTRPMIYKVFSIIMLVFAGIIFVEGLISLFLPFESVLNPLQDFVGKDAVGSLKAAIVLVKVLVFVFSTVVSVLMLFLEFAYFYSFSNIVRRQKDDSRAPFSPKELVCPVPMLKVFGIIVFVVQAIRAVSGGITVLSIIQLLDGISGFLAGLLTTLTVLVTAAEIVFFVFHYIVRFNIFGHLVEFISKDKPGDEDKDKLKQTNSQIATNMCYILFALDAVFCVASVILIIVAVANLVPVIGAAALALLIPSLILMVAEALYISVYGCMYDNLAMAIDHEKIRYRMLG